MKKLYRKFTNIVMGQLIGLFQLIGFLFVLVTVVGAGASSESEPSKLTILQPALQDSNTLAFDYAFEALPLTADVQDGVILKSGRKILFSEFQLDKASSEAVKSLKSLQKAAFETKRKKLLVTFLRLIEHKFSQKGIRYGLIVKDKALLLASRELNPLFVERYFQDKVNVIKNQSVESSVDDVIFDLLETLYVNISRSPLVVAEAEEVGYSFSLRLFGNLIIKDQGTGAGVGIGISVGQNFKTGETVFQLYSEFDYPSAADYASFQVGVNGVVSYYMKKKTGNEPLSGVYFNPLASPIKPVYGPDFINFSLPLAGMEFPPILTSMMQYQAESIRVPLIQVGFSKLSKKFTHILFLKPPGSASIRWGAKQGVNRVAIDMRKIATYLILKAKQKKIVGVNEVSLASTSSVDSDSKAEMKSPQCNDSFK